MHFDFNIGLSGFLIIPIGLLRVYLQFISYEYINDQGEQKQCKVNTKLPLNSGMFQNS